ncbi:hypothetical protein EC9_25190 [Rosistilla ulvae]|uniref:Uncharacterized protein n=1 Tax=Rosistilla ulvae TaxID=1930277 RepID=A0A517M0H6_9BACT|nr:hypothetical protein [Rosistilla ulvae]QDS88329.1 hypothetical protein EC9_25190 [Rosistilla ulvae]
MNVKKENLPIKSEDECLFADSDNIKSMKQRRRMLLTAAMAGGPLIVAGSAQKAYADGGGSGVSGGTITDTDD